MCFKKGGKTLILMTIVSLMALNQSFSQVAINSDGTSADSSAMLDVKSSTKGFLIPQMIQTEIEDISSPADGLIVYNTDDHRFYFYDAGDSFWKKMEVGSGTIIPGGCNGTFTDARDGKTYAQVQIGDQCWMAENLNVGTMINSSNGGTNSDGEQTNNEIIEKYCYEDTNTNCIVYGGLYQWNELMQYATTEGVQGVCPDGWHIPTDAEWCELENEVDAGTVQCDVQGWRGSDGGGNLKEIGEAHWWTSNTGATDLYDFTALPGGARLADGSFGDLNMSSMFWTSTENSTEAWYHMLSYAHADMFRSDFDKNRGYSVRCVHD